MEEKNKIAQEVAEQEKADAQKRWLNNMVTEAFTKNSPNNK
ncbi:MAG: hypothetical protein ACLFPL_04880 [Candidatus Nanoarchaeia archaeon]